MSYRYSDRIETLKRETRKEVQMKITEHFTWEEAKCKDGTEVPNELRPNAILIASEMEVLRNEINKPIQVHSWYRTKAYNAKIGGKPLSQHLEAKAIDFSVDGFTPAQLKDKIEKLIEEGRMKQGGIGLYPTFVHYDIRGIKARW